MPSEIKSLLKQLVACQVERHFKTQMKNPGDQTNAGSVISTNMNESIVPSGFVKSFITDGSKTIGTEHEVVV